MAITHNEGIKIQINRHFPILENGRLFYALEFPQNMRELHSLFPKDSPFFNLMQTNILFCYYLKNLQLTAI